jgi:hypothetical protein
VHLAGIVSQGPNIRFSNESLIIIISIRFMLPVDPPDLMRYRREFMCSFKLVHKVPGGNSGPESDLMLFLDFGIYPLYSKVKCSPDISCFMTESQHYY